MMLLLALHGTAMGFDSKSIMFVFVFCGDWLTWPAGCLLVAVRSVWADRMFWDLVRGSRCLGELVHGRSGSPWFPCFWFGGVASPDGVFSLLLWDRFRWLSVVPGLSASSS